MPLLLQDLITRLQHFPRLLSGVSLADLELVLQLFAHLRPRLLWSKSEVLNPGPPLALPEDVVSLCAYRLCAVPTNFHRDCIRQLWLIARCHIWEDTAVDLLPGKNLVDYLLFNAAREAIGVFNFYPPMRFCMNEACCHHGRPRALGRVSEVKATFFSAAHGPVPVRSYSAACSACSTRYYPTYLVYRPAAVRHQVRVYYEVDGDAPVSLIHVTAHSYVESTLCSRITMSAVFPWSSFSNASEVYNSEHRNNTPLFPPEWPAPSQLSGELAFDSMLIHSLVQDHWERSDTLQMRHDTDQDDRLKPALKRRNQRLSGTGQEMWNHACDLCCYEKVDSGGNTIGILRAIVTDGVTVGRPCCGILNCAEPLPSQRSRYCWTHEHNERKCVVTACDTPARSGFHTCSNHWSSEKDDQLHSAMFQLKLRGRKTQSGKHPKAQAVVEAESLDSAISTLAINVDDSEGTSPTSSTGPRVRYGRRWTHNEQLAVNTCGIIAGRTTMIGSESVTNAKLFLKQLYPTRNSLPQVIFYDNACSLKKHLLASGEHHFDNVAMPVDVFHMKSKHKGSDEFCATHCNPALIPELMVDGKWRFNSSAAEMVNAWFGEYQSMAREMRPERYEFFLDEMIKRKNIVVEETLRRRGCNPRYLSREFLLSE